jgi:hypothetical protein
VGQKDERAAQYERKCSNSKGDDDIGNCDSGNNNVAG